MAGFGEVELDISDKELRDLCRIGQAQKAISVIVYRMKDLALSQLMMAQNEMQRIEAQAYTRVVKTLEKKLINSNKEYEEAKKTATVLSPFQI